MLIIWKLIAKTDNVVYFRLIVEFKIAILILLRPFKDLPEFNTTVYKMLPQLIRRVIFIFDSWI